MKLYWMFDHQGYANRQLQQTVIQSLNEINLRGLLLDFGCGDCRYKKLVEALGFTYRGYDLVSPDQQEHVKNFVPGEKLSIEENTIDVVLSTQVLEHVWDINWYLSECYRVLQPDGKLVLSTHGVWPYHPHPQDYRRWTRYGLIREVEELGFKVESCKALLGPLAWTTQVRLLGLHVFLRKYNLLALVAKYLLYPLVNSRIFIEDLITPRQITNEQAAYYVLTCKKK